MWINIYEPYSSKSNNKGHSLLNLLLLVQQTAELAQVQQKLLVHFRVVILWARVLVGVGPEAHCGQRTLVKIGKGQVLQLPLGRLKAHRDYKHDCSVLPGQGLGQRKLLLNVVCQVSLGGAR